MLKQNELIQGRYQVIRLLGSGGFGAVYLAADQRLGRSVAIKEIDVGRLMPEERQSAEQLFEREARMLAALDHPSLTRIWDYFQQDRRAFLVMEYVPGRTLRDLLIQRGGPLDEALVLDCALQLCGVLAYLHARRPQVIFRDLKPANIIMVDPPPLPPGELPEPPVFRLIDFGIARLFKPDQHGDTLIIGTPGYAPPEQYGQGQTDERSDIYSLGATLYHLLGGKTPTSVPPPPLASINPQVAPGLARIVARATAAEPAERYQHIEDMRAELLALAPRAAPAPARASAPMPAPAPRIPQYSPAPTPFPLPPRRSASVLLVVLALVVLALVGVGGLVVAALDRTPGAAGRPTATPVARATVAPPDRDWLLPDAPGRIIFGQYNGGLAYQLMLATLDGQPPQPLDSSNDDFSPTLSPDGSQLAFARVLVKDKQAAIYAGSLKSRDFQPVAASAGYARYPAFSPDGSQLAFAIAPERQGSFKLALLDRASGQVRMLGPDRLGWLTWTPQGLTYAARLGADQAQDLFVLDANGQPRNLSNTSAVEEDFPAWSPDGSLLAYVASPAGSANLSQRQIFVMTPDGSTRTQLSSGPGAHTAPVWSPDGRWIAYLYQPPGGDRWQVWAMRADGSAPRRLASDAVDRFYLLWVR